jgi:hypothetical protein
MDKDMGGISAQMYVLVENKKPTCQREKNTDKWVIFKRT